MQQIEEPGPAGRRASDAAARQTTLVVHILAGGVWIGIDAVVPVLVLAGWWTATGGTC